MKIEKMKGSFPLNKKSTAITLMIVKSIKYEIGLKYPEYLPCLNKLKFVN